MTSEDESNPETFSFLYATDIHLGYQIENVIDSAKHDSFTAFEEILANFYKHQADCLLLGGDLFHSPHPPMDDRIRLRKLLKSYVYENPAQFPVSANQGKFKLLTKPSLSFANELPTFKDKNCAVKMPILSIYGNHDEVLADGNCIYDEYPEYINLVGKRHDKLHCDNEAETDHIISVYPTVLDKNGIKVAVYGLSYIRPESVEHLNLNFVRPKSKDQVLNTYNILLLHQDRFRDSIGLFDRNHIPDWFDIVLWGHEHQCRISEDSPFETETFKNVTDADHYRSLDIIQPGAPIPTSLSESECGDKFISKITLSLNPEGKSHKPAVKYQAIQLESIRKFVFYKEIITPGSVFTQNRVLRKLEEILEKLEKPGFIRLRFQSEHSMKQIKDMQLDLPSIWVRLDEKFQKMIANPRNFLLYRKKAVKHKFVNNLQVMIHNEDDERDQESNNLADDIRSMIGSGGASSLTMLEEEAQNKAAGLNTLMENIADKLLKQKDMSYGIDPNEFLDTLEHSDTLGAAQFERDMKQRSELVI